MDNEGLLQLIKNIVERAVTESNTNQNPGYLLKLYQNSLQGIWEEVKLWKPKNQRHHSMEQAFGLINNEYPIGLWGFYSGLIKEGWQPTEAFQLTQTLMALLLGPKQQ